MLNVVLSVLLLLFVAAAEAASYGDLWWNPAEPGWGAQIVQSNTYQFVTFFVYGPDGNPTWLMAQLRDDGTGNRFTGDLFTTRGTYYGAAWDASAFRYTVVGTASLQGIDPYHATLTYALATGPTVTRTVERQTLTAFLLGGTYSGSIAGSVTGCANPADNIPAVRGRFTLNVTQAGDESATLRFTFTDTTYSGMVCTVAGPLTHLGALYQMSNAQYTCTGQSITPGTTSATIDRLHTTQQGIEGRWVATSGGCTQSIRFAAVVN